MRKWILIGIVMLAFLLRVPHLSSFPQGFTPDEASFGYDAFSILHTGKDQWGHTLPLVLESFGDFKPPLYSYVAVPFVALLGLNETSVRLPNALLGSLAVLVVYFLVKQLFKKYDKKEHFALASSFLLAISPWHVMMSRGAFEANLTTFLMPLGVLLFIKGIKNNRVLLLSTLVFGLNLFSYHSARVVTPLLVIGLLVLYRKDILKISRRYLIAFFMVLGIFGVGTLYTFNVGAGTRVSDISVFAGAMQEAATPRLELINSGVSPQVAKLLHNKFTVAIPRFVNNYTQYYSLKFLITDGPNEATYGMVPGMGTLYLIEVLFLVGFVCWLYRNPRSKEGWFLLFWILVAPIPAALAQGVGYSANRVVVILPALSILSAIGFVTVAGFLSRKSKLPILAVCFALSILIVLQGLKIASQYLLPSRALAAPMLYGRGEALKHVGNSEKVILSRSLSEPHIYVAFYTQSNVDDYQENSKNWGEYRERGLKFLDQLDPYYLSKYEFTSIEGKEKSELSGYTVVGKPEEFNLENTPSEIIYYPSGEEAIYIVEYD
ncbi:ArnT family glycosyltransferase [Patescibacteria group bacterium]